jgi:hypothetical protein
MAITRLKIIRNIIAILINVSNKRDIKNKIEKT